MLKKSKFILGFAAFFLMSSILSTSFVREVHAGMASGSKFLGNIISNSAPSSFGTYWNQVTPENSTKWGSVEGSRNNMSWSAADTAYNYARSNDFTFKFHTLVWGSQEPGWISGLSAADQKAEVTQWIQAAGQRYGGSQFVDVVNEPLHAKPSYRNAIGGDGTTGWDWVIWSFQQARQAFPNSKLLINEYGIISDPNAAANYVTIINLLKSRGLVDGIGIQCHYFNMDNVSVSTMNSVLNTLSATGLPIYVSEMDMTGDDNTQLARYQQKFPVLWENDAVKGITLWGYIEGQTWASGTHLLTSSGTERPALRWLKQYLAENPGTGDSGSGDPGSGDPGGGDSGNGTVLADFESGTDGWLGSNIVGDPLSTTAWASKGAGSLQVDIAMSGNSQHYAYKMGNADFTGYSQLKATVKGASTGNYGTGIGVKIYVKYGNNYFWKDSGWRTISAGGTADLSLDLSSIDKAGIKEYGIQFTSGSNASGQTSVYVDNVSLVN